MIRSVLYIPPDVDRWPTLSQLSEFAEDHGWPPGAYTHDWRELAELLGCPNEYDIGVIPSRATLPPDRLPRIVALDQRVPIIGGHRSRWTKRRGGSVSE